MYIKVWDNFNIRNKKGIHFYLHRVDLFHPENCSFRLEVVYNEQLQFVVNLEQEGISQLNCYKYIDYQENQWLTFNLYKIDLSLNPTLIKSSSLELPTFASNIVYPQTLLLESNNLS